MAKLLKGLVVSVSLVLLANAAMAAGLSPAQCDRLQREYTILLKKEKQHRLTPADRKRMHEIDDQTNIYCN